MENEIRFNPEENLASRFLSNSSSAWFLWQGKYWPSVVHTLAASKTEDPELRETIRIAGPAHLAAKLGDEIPSTAKWALRKTATVYELVRLKFAAQRFAEKLLGTGEADLLDQSDPEGNSTGKILMRVRQELRLEKQELDDLI